MASKKNQEVRFTNHSAWIKLNPIQKSGIFDLNVLKSITSRALRWTGKYWQFEGERYQLKEAQ